MTKNNDIKGFCRWKMLAALIALFLTTQFPAMSIDFAQKSVLSEGNWYKISVAESGICKLTFSQIKQMGFSDPTKISIFGRGGGVLSEKQQDKWIDDLQEIPIYQGTDYYLFYAQGPLTVKQALNSNKCSLKSNPYSLLGYYFVTDNVGEKKRIAARVEPADTVGTLSFSEIAVYLDRQIHKKEEFNRAKTGIGWYGDQFGNGESATFNFSFPDYNTEEPASIAATFAGYSPNPFSMDVKATIGDSTFTKTYNPSLCPNHVYGREFSSFFSCPTSNGKSSIEIKLNGNFGSDEAFIESVVATAYRPLKMSSSGTLFFRNPQANGSDARFRYTLSGCTDNVQVWDITDPNYPASVRTEKNGDVQTFTDYSPQAVREFVAVNVSAPKCISAALAGSVANQNLHAEATPDLVIITHPNFMEGAKRIAALHEEYDGMNVLITTPEQVYNEFSSGTPDATAIRWFMKKLYDQSEQTPFHLLLIGDGSYDNRGITATKSFTPQNYIVTYQSGEKLDATSSYVSDDYFSFLDDKYIRNADAAPRIAVGRIPCDTEAELDGYINKVVDHLENKSYGKWKNRLVLLADDNEESSSYQRFCQYSDVLATRTKGYNNAMEVKKIYLDAYSRTTGSNGSRYPEVESLIDEEISNGVMVFNYIGHSSIVGFSAEHVFTQAKAGSVYNKNCGFWFTASCEFAKFDGDVKSGGEDLILNPNGGAISLVSSARTVYDNRNDNLNRAYFSHLFDRDEDGLPIRIGDVFRMAKMQLTNDSNRLSFGLFGDPALRLHYPNNLVMTDSILEIGGGKTDTIRALSEVQVYGHIADYGENELEDFNGTMYITLYDKEVTLYTKANIYTDETDIIRNRHSYKDRPNVLFSGKAEVVDGKFTFCFKVPKDINYSYGTSRFSYYAYDEERGYEAQGAHEQLIIGGSNNNESYEEEGPIVDIYLNSEKFKSGDKVNNSPVFYAIADDENGINASGAGIGHDITLTMNGSTSPIVLNNYFTYDLNSYKSGIVKYQLSDLEEGTYTLTFKIWDLLNNSTTKSITFTVDNDSKPAIEEFIAYPNPAKEQISFLINHNRPEVLQTYRLLVYDLTGTPIFQSDDVTAKDEGSTTLTWNLRLQTGRRVDPGCYVARFEIETETDKYVGKSKKIIVLPQ